MCFESERILIHFNFGIWEVNVIELLEGLKLFSSFYSSSRVMRKERIEAFIPLRVEERFGCEWHMWVVDSEPLGQESVAGEFEEFGRDDDEGLLPLYVNDL